MKSSKKIFKKNEWGMVIVILCWGLNLPLIKIALREIPTLPFNAIRLTLASLALLAIFALNSEPAAFARRDLPRLVFLSLCGHTFYQLFFINGLDHTTVTNTAVIFAISPIAISLLSSFFKQERIGTLGWLGILVAFGGAYMVVTGKSGRFQLSSATLKGDLILIAAVLMWAAYTVMSKPLLHRHSPLKVTAFTMGIGTLGFIPFSVPSFSAFSVTAVSAKAWLFLVYSGLIALSLCYLLWFRSVKQVGNSQTAVFSNLQPLVSMAFAFWILGEPLTRNLAAGTALIFAGLYLTRRGPRKPPT